MDPSADKRSLGLLIAANPVGQLISSPLFGYLANRSKSIRMLCIATGLMNVLGFSLYASVGALPQPRRYFMVAARFIVGIAAGSITLCISYISKATTTAERTTYISINALVMTLGFVLGPVIQSSLIPIGEEGYQLGYGDWTLNMYTLAAWLSAAVSFLGLFLFLPCVFQEFDIAVKEAEYLVSMNECRTRHKECADPEERAFLGVDAAEEKPAPSRADRDWIGVALCIANFFVVGFILISVETLATPLAIEQLGYSDDEAVRSVGIVFSIGCALTAVSYAVSSPLARRITERRVLVFCGLLPLTISYVISFPYSGPTPLMQSSSGFDNGNGWPLDDVIGAQDDNSSSLLATTMPLALIGDAPSNRSGVIIKGCPTTQQWCLNTPAIQAIPLVASFMVTCIGYAFSTSMSTSTLTKVLATQDQGVWMGIYLSAGSLSRIVGPLYLSWVYTVHGTWATCGSLIAILAVLFVVNVVLSDHLTPLLERDRSAETTSDATR